MKALSFPAPFPAPFPLTCPLTCPGACPGAVSRTRFAPRRGTGRPGAARLAPAAARTVAGDAPLR